MMVLDTNILIHYIESDTRVSQWLETMVLRGEHFASSTISVTELLGYTKITDEQTFLTVDSIIAATAIVLHAPLVSRDTVFKKLRGCKVITP